MLSWLTFNDKSFILVDFKMKLGISLIFLVVHDVHDSSGRASERRVGQLDVRLL